MTEIKKKSKFLCDKNNATRLQKYLDKFFENSRANTFNPLTHMPILGSSN